MIAVATVWAALAQPAAAAEPPVDLGPLADALAEQLTRNQALILPDAPAIYHLRYHLLELDQVDVHASLGGLVESEISPFNLLAVEVRVGSPALDNTGFGGWQDGFLRAALPETLTPDALAAEAWRTTDAAYKQAVEQYARKASQFVPPPDYPGDYTLTGPVVADDGVGAAEPDAERLETLAELLSRAMVGDPGLIRGEVYVGHEAGSLITLDTEGTRVRTPVEETTIRAVMALRAPSDGMLLTDQRLWTVRAVDDLPAQAEMLSEIAEMRDGLSALAKAPPLADEYVGPVLFEDGASLDLLRHVLTNQLEGTPPEIPFDSFFGELGEDRGPVRIGRRVLPPGWAVEDDPTAMPEHPGAYAHDNEGTPSQPVILVHDGIVRTVAMSRVPRRGVTESNGHARGLVGQRGDGRVSMWTVTPDRRRTRPRMYHAAFKLAHSYGNDYVIVVRRLQEPCVRALDADVYSDAAISVPPPVGVVRRYADGREELVRGAAFAGIERWILRDVAAAGPERAIDYFAPLSGNDYASLAPTEGMASHLAGPELLIGEVEIVPAPADPRELPVLPPPVASR